MASADFTSLAEASRVSDVEKGQGTVLPHKTSSNSQKPYGWEVQSLKIHAKDGLNTLPELPSHCARIYDFTIDDSDIWQALNDHFAQYTDSPEIPISRSLSLLPSKIDNIDWCYHENGAPSIYFSTISLREGPFWSDFLAGFRIGMRKEGPEVGESKKDEENIRFFHLHGEKLIVLYRRKRGKSSTRALHIKTVLEHPNSLLRLADGSKHSFTTLFLLNDFRIRLQALTSNLERQHLTILRHPNNYTLNFEE
ncbi:hypothetical protein GX50_02957 [[Emmonsia] crescens]|uniref:Uncharacterized protein n=1 Tax=[Emmonsia] crescens TaxID=73230 RepID=A0A2B7ZLY5_9EURO|nr:hypothetical protein GX50_02957 [Emmonsia crescens]